MEGTSFGIEGVEAELRAIENEIRQARDNNLPGYMRERALDAIGQRIGRVRTLLQAPIADLTAFYRVSDILAARMGNHATRSWLGAEIDRSVRGAVLQAIDAAHRHAEVTDALVAYSSDIAPISHVAEVLGYRKGTIHPAQVPYQRHALVLRLNQFLGDAAMIEQVATALMSWVMTPEPEPDIVEPEPPATNEEIDGLLPPPVE